MSPIEGDKEENENKLFKIYLERYNKSNLKKKNTKFKVGETVRIWSEGTVSLWIYGRFY